MPKSPLYLNLGCGKIFYSSPEWVNIDIFPAEKKRIHQYQLLLGIPFGDNVFDGVYHSHVLEHFPREQVPPFLRECLRVLRPGGTLRIAVPDLEAILHSYLAALEAARAGEIGARDRLLWMQTELIDQMTRRYSGGLMAPAWQKADDALATFIHSRVGGELDTIPRAPQPSPLSLPERPLSFSLPDTEFLFNGECHQWMYDSFSLSLLLQEAGFINIRATSHRSDKMGGFQPDCNEQGKARKPDSFYMEAEKPAGSPTSPVITLFATTDMGGAGIAALRLHDGLRQHNASSIVYLQYKAGTQAQAYVLPPAPDDRIVPDGHGGAFLASRSKDMRAQAHALAQWPDRPAGSEAFSASEAFPRLRDIPLLDQSDIFHFHWVAGFLDIPANTDFLKNKKIVWTLHDMNPFTGGCHYADGCDGYLYQCGSCPQLGSAKELDLSRRTWKRREYAYRNLDITVVAPSRWLAEEARKSSLMGRFPVHCIPNGLPTDIFKPYPKAAVRNTLGIPCEEKVLLFSADNILNRRKGFRYLLEALLLLHKENVSENITLLLLGNGGEQVRELPFTVKALGNLSSPQAMAAAYSAADAVVLPSLEDNLPNVLIEAQACGTPAVAFAVGGIPEIVEHEKNGWLAPARDVQALATCLRQALNNSSKYRPYCRTHALEKFSLQLHVQSYKELYHSFLKGEQQ